MNALWIAKDLSEYLDSRGTLTCHVHSTFKEALNLLDDTGELIALLPEHKGVAPMSLITSWLPAQLSKIVQNDIAIVTTEGVHFPRTDIKINSCKAVSVSCEIDISGCEWSLETVERNLDVLRQTLVSCGDWNGLLPLIHCFDLRLGRQSEMIIENNAYCEFIQDVFIEIVELLIKGANEQVRMWLPKFIGFGPGLTPSTDDFLAGIMASLAYESALKSTVNAPFSNDIYQMSIGRTTTISEMMLKHASKGHVACVYRAAVRSLFMTDQTNMRTQLENVIQIGASSGTDFLLGVYCYYSLVIMESKHKGGSDNGTL